MCDRSHIAKWGVTLVLLLLVSGCGMTEGVVQKEPESYLWFTGNIENAMVYIDDLEPFLLAPPRTAGDTEARPSRRVHYRISPGKHTVIVKKAGREVVHRNLLLGSGLVKEIAIP